MPRFAYSLAPDLSHPHRLLCAIDEEEARDRMPELARLILSEIVNNHDRQALSIAEIRKSGDAVIVTIMAEKL